MTEKTTAVQIVMPQHCNGYAKPRLFGGQIMAWIDVTGAVAARRYAQKAVTTVCIDQTQRGVGGDMPGSATLRDPYIMHKGTDYKFSFLLEALG